MIRVPRWYEERGDEYDVVISSRARLSRNLADYRFPPAMDREEASRVKSFIREAFRRCYPEAEYAELPYDGNRGLTRFLEETTLLSSDEERRESAVIRVGRPEFHCLLNIRDHLRLSVTRGGLDIRSCLMQVVEIDEILEKHLHCAVTLEWGYLTSEVDLAGTGLRLSVLVHLPALAMGSDIREVYRRAEQAGLSVSPLYPAEPDAGMESRADLYVIMNKRALGSNEETMAEKLEGTVQELLHYEREIRAMLMDKRRQQLEESLRRSLEIIDTTSVLPFRESLKLVSLIRMGCAIGLVTADVMETLSGLFFRVQPHHIRLLSDELENSENVDMINKERANMVRKRLSAAIRRGGDDV